MPNAFLQIYCMTLSSLTPSLLDLTLGLSWPQRHGEAPFPAHTQGSARPAQGPGPHVSPPGTVSSCPGDVTAQLPTVLPCMAMGPTEPGYGCPTHLLPKPKGERGVSRVFITCWDLSHGLFGCCFALCTEVLCVSQMSQVMCSRLCLFCVSLPHTLS